MRHLVSGFIGLVIWVGLFIAPAADGGEMAKGIDVIPTPRVTEMTEQAFVLNDAGKPKAVILVDRDDPKAAIAAQEINDQIIFLGGTPLAIEKAAGKEGRQVALMNIIRLTVSPNHEEDIYPEIGAARDILASKGGQGYFIRFYQGRGKNGTALFCGTDSQGLLYASSTFRFLLRKSGARIYAAEAQIIDWPDFTNRGFPVWPLPGSYDEFKRYVDWAFHYKFNRIYTYTTRRSDPDGFNLPTGEERKYLKRINRYARDRGILINYALTWGVGIQRDSGKDDYRDTVVFNGQNYTWSDDDLLRKRAADVARFAKEVEADSMHLHCMDTYEENWDKRTPRDRGRYGNDRSAADANVINIFADEIRKINPGIELQFVVYPYRINFDLPGNEKYRAWMTRLTNLIPKDVYLVVTEMNRNQADSWVKIVRQPLVHWINGDAFQWGRYFSTLPAYTKSAHYEGRDRDIIIHMEPVGHFEGETIQSIAAEYAWNVNGPGSGTITEDRGAKIRTTGADLHYRQEVIDGKIIGDWAWYEGTEEPEQAAGPLLLKACRHEFGEAAAPYMVEFFRNNPVGWRSPTLYNQVLRDVMAGKELDASRDQLRKAEKALSALKRALSVSHMEVRTRERLKRLLKNTYQQTLTISGTSAKYEAMSSLMKGFTKEASEEIRKGRQRLATLREEMAISGYWSDDSREWYEEGFNMIRTVEIGTRKDTSTNLIRNPGFEEKTKRVDPNRPGIPRWSASGSVTLSKEAHSGDYAGQLTLKPTEQYVFMEQPFNVRPECAGYVEFWLRKDGDFRVIPVLQYRDPSTSKKIENLAIDGFPFGSAVGDYTLYSGRFKFPPHVNQAVFKIYADWSGFVPAGEKVLYVDDAFVSCASSD